LIFISHDVHFIRRVANHVIEVRDGRLRAFPDNYQYYLDKTAAESAPVARPGYDTDARGKSPGDGLNRKEQKRLEAEARNARARERREQKQVVDKLEARIARLETRQRELTAQLEEPETYQHGGRAREINMELADITADLETTNARWEAAAEKLTALS
jgi:ATP-binding cassette subfamily F protein 3